jgi:S-adenosylmethionine hydrolase
MTLRQCKGKTFPVRSIILATVLAVLVLLTALCSAQVPNPPSKYPPTIVFMTDFGVVDDSVALCRGVMYSIMPDVRIVDLTHEVTPFSILDGARFLYGATPYFPAGTVFVVVIDPTVGSMRKAIVARSKRGQYFVLPDNGLLTLVEQRDGIDAVREITNPEWMIGSKLSSTFHGRDIFSPAGAHLARGDDWTQAGPALDVTQLTRITVDKATVEASGLHGEVIGTDGPFGNLVLDVPQEVFAQLGYRIGDTIPVILDGKSYSIPLHKTFSDVAIGKPLFYIDSRGRLSLAINQGNFAENYHIEPPAQLFIPRKQ